MEEVKKKKRLGLTLALGFQCKYVNRMLEEQLNVNLNDEPKVGTKHSNVSSKSSYLKLEDKNLR